MCIVFLYNENVCIVRCTVTVPGCETVFSLQKSVELEKECEYNVCNVDCVILTFYDISVIVCNMFV